MTGNGWLWIGGFCVVWVAAGYYFLFVKGNRKMGFAGVVATAPKEDSEVIVSNSKIMINIQFAEDEKKEATPALLADFVISFKDIVSGTYKVPSVASAASEPVTVQSLTGSGPGKKEVEEKEPDQDGLPGEEIPDLSDEPEMPELDTENIPERGPESKVILDESQLVDSNTLILNMLNLN